MKEKYLKKFSLTSISLIAALITVFVFTVLTGILATAYASNSFTVFGHKNPEIIEKLDANTGLKLPEHYNKFRYMPDKLEKPNTYKIRFKLSKNEINQFINANNLNKQLRDNNSSEFPCNQVFEKDDKSIDWWNPQGINQPKCAKFTDTSSTYKIYIYYGQYYGEDEYTLLIYLAKN